MWLAHSPRCDNFWFAQWLAQHECQTWQYVEFPQVHLSWKWPFPFKKGGMFNFTPKGARSSCISNPRSAISTSPLAQSLPRMPDFAVRSLSEIDPPSKVETKFIAPSPLIPMWDLLLSQGNYSIRNSFRYKAWPLPRQHSLGSSIHQQYNDIFWDRKCEQIGDNIS